MSLLFQINAVFLFLFYFLIIKESWKKITFHKNNKQHNYFNIDNKKKGF